MRFLAVLLVAAPCFAQTCPPPTPLLPVDSQTGRLSAASCALPDGSLYNEYLFTLPVRGTFQISAKGTGFTPSALLRTNAGVKIDAGASISQYLESGTYRLLTNAPSAGQSGPYTLTTAFIPELNILCNQSPLLGVGRTRSAALGTSSCRLPDQSAYDSYRITVYGTGTLNLAMSSAEFQTSVILRNDQGVAIGSDTGGAGGNNSALSLAVDGNQTYTLIASAAGAAQPAGKYQISSSFIGDADTSCKPLASLQNDVPAPGSVSAASCNFNLPGRHDSSPFNIYDLHVDTAGVALIQVNGAGFNPLLLLLDADGNSVSQDYESGGPGIPSLRQQLAPGDYRLLVFNTESVEGDYTLQYNFQAANPQPCAVNVLNSETPAAGTLDGISSCRADYLISDIYKIVLPSAGSVDLNLASADFTTVLVLRDAKNNLVTVDAQTTDGSNAHLAVDLAAGTYYVGAGSADLPGSYSVNYQWTGKNLPACANRPAVALNGGYIGSLGSGDCVDSLGRMVDYYTFTTTVAGTVGAFMTSSVLDSLLTLTDSTGKVLRLDDNSYGANNAAVIQYLPKGTYRLEARAADPKQVGKYRVDVLFSSGPRPAFCSPARLDFGVPQNGNLGLTSCQYLDNTFSDVYSFSVTDPSTPVDMAATSIAFDAFLILTDSRGSVLSTDDNSGGGQNPEILQTLDPGTYFLIVKPADFARSNGNYTIKIQ